MSSISNKQRKIKNTFTREEDKIIQDFVQANGYERIPELTKQLTNRTARQIRERFRLYLDASVKHDEFSIDEDKLLIKNVNEIG
jgi:hypothetical protein